MPAPPQVYNQMGQEGGLRQVVQGPRWASPSLGPSLRGWSGLSRMELSRQCLTLETRVVLTWSQASDPQSQTDASTSRTGYALTRRCHCTAASREGTKPVRGVGFRWQESCWELPWWLRRSRIRLQWGRPGFDPQVGKIHWRRERLPTPVFWPGEFHGQRSLAVYSPWGRKASDTTEQLSLSISLFLELLRSQPAKLGERELRVSWRRKRPTQVSAMGGSCVVWAEKTHPWAHEAHGSPETAYLELLYTDLRCSCELSIPKWVLLTTVLLSYGFLE